MTLAPEVNGCHWFQVEGGEEHAVKEARFRDFLQLRTGTYANSLILLIVDFKGLGEASGCRSKECSSYRDSREVFVSIEPVS